MASNRLKSWRKIAPSKMSYCAIIIIIMFIIIIIIIVIIIIIIIIIYSTNNFLLKVNNRNFSAIETLKNGVKYYKFNKKRHQNDSFIYACHIIVVSL